MSTSIHDGIVEFAASLYGAAADPVDTAIARDGVANGLLHCADSYAQVRVNYAAPVSAVTGNDHDNHLTLDITPVASTWYLMTGFPMGLWPVTLRADGTPYALRIRAGGSVSGGTGTATFRFVLAPIYHLALDGISDSLDSSFECSTTSTSAVWLTNGVSQATSSATVMQITANQASEWTRSVQVYDAVSGASSHTTDQCLVSLWCFAKTSSAASVPRLHNVHLAEYVGAPP